MRYYFVRHAESKHNAVQKYSAHSTHLSDIGKKQAHLLAKRFENIPIGIVIASPFVRVKETAAVINKVVKKEVVFTPLLQERKDPSEVAGKPYSDKDAYAILKEVRNNYADPNWHYSDEENAHDLIVRARKFLEYAENFTQEHILVVGHNAVIKAIVATIVFRSSVTPDVVHRFDESFEMSNTGITICEKDPGDFWRVVTWNDDVHIR